MSFVMNLRCPVCPRVFTVSYDDGVTWGEIPIDDNGCALVTRNAGRGGEEIDDHVRGHWKDGTAHEVLNRKISGWHARDLVDVPAFP